MRPWIVIGSANGSTNLGDQSMWEAAIHELRRCVGPVPVITDCSEGWSVPLEDVTTLRSLHTGWVRWGGRPRSRPEAALRLLVNAGHVGPGLKKAECFVRQPDARQQLESQWEQAIDQAAGVVVSGAGAINDEYAMHGVAGWRGITGRAKRQGKPVALIGHGIGPLNRPHIRAGAGRLLRDADLVTTRDRVSAEIAAGLGAVRPVPTADWAIALPVQPADRAHAEAVHRELLGDHPFVALSLQYRRSASVRERKAVFGLMAEVGRVARQDGNAVLLVPNQTLIRRGDDRNVLRLLAASITESADGPPVAVLEKQMGAAQTRALLGRCRWLCGARYHPLVFALAEGRPAGGIAFDPYYTQKFGGALAWYGRQDWVWTAGSGTRARAREIVNRLSAPDAEEGLDRTPDLLRDLVRPLDEWLTTVAA